MSSNLSLNLHIVPEEVPYCKLEIKKIFEQLTDKEKIYAHHIGQGCWLGSLIVLHQVSPESPLIFNFLQKLFKEPLNELKSRAIQSGVQESTFNQFLQFAGLFYANMGNYLSFGDTKFIPRLSEQDFRSIVQVSSAATELLPIFDSIVNSIYSLTVANSQLGIDGKGISTYYSSDITTEDCTFVQKFLDSKNISPYNTLLFKIEGGYEVKVASVAESLEEHQFEGKKILIRKGIFSRFLQYLVDHLREALNFCANENQERMLKAYIDHFISGSIELHKESQKHWIKDISPAIETNIGFIESYRDPFGVRGEFEGFVAMVDKELSLKFGELVKNARDFIKLLPWPTDFEKDNFILPDFTSLEVLAFANSGVPAGINIPNYDDIRQKLGFKNVSLANAIRATPSQAKTIFVEEKYDQLFKDKITSSFEVQVGLHELLGHGSGKLFVEDEHGKLNFDIEKVKNPLTGEKIGSWYKNGATYDTVFTSIGSAIEECRAECVGIFLCIHESIQNLFGHYGQDAQDNIYINWLQMCRAGLIGLEFYSPNTRTWRQAHMQARYAILKVLLAAGEGFVSIERIGNDDLCMHVDPTKINSVGVAAIGKFLQQIQVYKATANVEAITWFTEITTPNEEHIAMRDIVIAKKRPRRQFVQMHTKRNNSSVELVEFEGSVEGIIQSFQVRFSDIQA
eukprot:TRINITY_DN313_c0_g3_i1.p1 TRINITY_DN313_c0_g3~~TRINITY_DN313_c0_g3_i1.p1  ORF type:complete len:682 (-),score=302.86 TRINITY_DN313_c0_g3_i1:80-2125(-)